MTTPFSEKLKKFFGLRYLKLLNGLAFNDFCLLNDTYRKLRRQESSDKNWEWLNGHLKNVTATNAAKVTNDIVAVLHKTRVMSSALIAQLLRLNQKLMAELIAEKEASQKLSETHEIEKQNLLKLIYTLNQLSTPEAGPTATPKAGPSATPEAGPTAPPEAGLSATPEAGLSATPSVSTSSTELTVSQPKNRNKSPRRMLECKMANEADQINFKKAWYPPPRKYENVSEFLAIFEGDNFCGGGGYKCRNCDGIVMSGDEKNNQRTFSNHLKVFQPFKDKKSRNNGNDHGEENGEQVSA